MDGTVCWIPVVHFYVVHLGDNDGYAKLILEGSSTHNT